MGPTGGVVLVGEFVLEDPCDGVEARGAHHDEIGGDGREVRRCRVDEVGQRGLEAVVTGEFSERVQPRRTLATERKGIRLAGKELVHQSTPGCAGGSPFTGAS